MSHSAKCVNILYGGKVYFLPEAILNEQSEIKGDTNHEKGFGKNRNTAGSPQEPV